MPTSRAVSRFQRTIRRPADGGIGALRANRGSVLVIVMITLLFTTFALVAFMEKASNDLIVDQREVIGRRLRAEAYSALETTLAVLEDFRQADSGLHSPTEGWGDPLTFASYTPTEGRTVEVAFEDESGKISLPHVNATVLSQLFQSWSVQQNDADVLADALMGWMQRNHVYASALVPAYEQSAIPYDEPQRPMRSFSELAAIDKVREFFYDENGRPNDNWRRFVGCVSLFDFAKPNINGAKPETLTALGQYDPTQQQNLTDYLTGTGSYQTQGPGYFQNAAQAQSIAGNGNTGAFVTTISALRILITVHEGSSQFRLAAVIAPLSGGATTVQTKATSKSATASASNTPPPTQQQTQPNASQPNASQAGNSANSRNLRYPFTLLEIRENDEIPPAPPPPASNQNL
jgi:hypothetical protein